MEAFTVAEMNEYEPGGPVKTVARMDGLGARASGQNPYHNPGRAFMAMVAEPEWMQFRK
jgi:hypothetical protein